MNILMTGAGGFIGKHFINTFEEMKCKDQLTLLSSKPNNKYYCIDYTNQLFSTKEMERVPPIDCILLLGAFVEHKGPNEKDIVHKHLSSLQSIDFLLHNLPSLPQKIVYCSSVSIYGFDSTIPYKSNDGTLIDERTKINPIRTYALSKVFGERLVSEWCSENNISCQIIRIGTVFDYSGLQSNFLSYVIKSILEEKEFLLSAPLNQVRNFVYIDDVCRWILNAIRLNETPGVINLTSSENYTISELISLIEKNYNYFKYSFENNGIFRGTDMGFNSTKREIYLGKEYYPVSVSLPSFLKQLIIHHKQ